MSVVSSVPSEATIAIVVEKRNSGTVTIIHYGSLCSWRWLKAVWARIVLSEIIKTIASSLLFPWIVQTVWNFLETMKALFLLFGKYGLE
jgi:hypothetical protein